jgi:acyl-CoA thioesterase FadM
MFIGRPELSRQPRSRLDDVLAISCEPAQNGGASLAFEQSIWRDSIEGELLLCATVRVACLDAQSLKPKRLPAVIIRELQA